MTARVTNIETKAVYVHRNLNRNDIDWISLNPNLRIEILRKR
jgi:hypothetical protein